MLWSLFKILLFVAIVAALAWGAAWLLEAEGGMVVTVAGTEFTLGPLQSVIAGLILLALLWLVLKLVGLLIATLRFIAGDETAVSRYFSRSRERKGYEALSASMMALAAGEGKQAIAQANKAERYLGRPELTNLLLAQAAEMNGEAERAAEVYKKMLGDDKTRFVAVRGLMKQKLEAGDTDTALKLAEKAFAIKPRHEEVQDILLRLQAEHGDWAGARKTLGVKLKQGSLPRDVHKRRDAVLALQEARDVLDADAPIEAREKAIMANRMSPDLIPAAVMAARGYVEQGKPRYAARLLRKAWEAQPHPDLAAAFAEIAPDESPAERIKRFQALVRTRPDDPETKMLMAELYIAAEDFPAARKALGNLASEAPTARNLTIMAAIERGEGASDSVVRGWLTKALTAPRGPKWVCDNCQHVHGEWKPVCDRCSGFDTLSWRTPPDTEPSMPAGTEMLPLIVGEATQAPPPGPEPETGTPPADAAEDVTPAETPATDTGAAEQEEPGPEQPEPEQPEPKPEPELETTDGPGRVVR